MNTIFTEALARRTQRGTFRAPGRPRSDAAGPPPALDHSPAPILQVGAGTECFVTPPELAARVALLALPHPHTARLRCLEPSAGTGSMVRALKERAPAATVVAIEQHPDLARLAGARCADFLSLHPADLEPFDAVAMNPPFSKGQEARHVLHASRFLKPGARLAAIMSQAATFRDTGPYAELRRLMGQKQATCELLPDDAFKQSGASVRTVLVSFTN